MVVQQARNDAAVGHRIHTFCTPGNLMILENIRHVFFSCRTWITAREVTQKRVAVEDSGTTWKGQLCNDIRKIRTDIVIICGHVFSYDDLYIYALSRSCDLERPFLELVSVHRWQLKLRQHAFFCRMEPYIARLLMRKAARQPFFRQNHQENFRFCVRTDWWGHAGTTTAP